MFSARKVKGQKLYALARKGVEVERASKWVDIPEIRLLSFDGLRAKIHVCCGKGTYIRTLIHDIGERLGMGACMESLLRTRVGGFTLENSLTISQFETAFREGKLDPYFISAQQVKDRLGIS